MCWFLTTKTARRTETQSDPFAALVDHLVQDGLSDEAARLNVLLRQTAWTKGTEFLSAFGLAMLDDGRWRGGNRMWPHRTNFSSSVRAAMPLTSVMTRRVRQEPHPSAEKRLFCVALGGVVYASVTGVSMVGSLSSYKKGACHE